MTSNPLELDLTDGPMRRNDAVFLNHQPFPVVHDHATRYRSHN